MWYFCTMKKKLVCFFVAVFAMILLYGASPKDEAHKRLYQKEIDEALQNEVPADSIGDWYEALQTTMCMLIRRTELYRGDMRCIISNAPQARCAVYPDGTIVFTTGLLDYADTVLFQAVMSTPRLARNFNSERERFIAPILADALARFAFHFERPSVYAVHAPAVQEYSDRLTQALLQLAGYSPSLFVTWLERLQDIQTDSYNAEFFSSFYEQQNIPDRLTALHTSSVFFLAEDLSDILFALQTNIGTADAVQTIQGLVKRFPHNIYFERLQALALHKAWLNSLSVKDLELAHFLPLACNDAKTLRSLYENLAAAGKNAQMKFKTTTRKAVAGSRGYYDAAVNAYQTYLADMPEYGMQSAYARLLFESSEKAALALRLAKNAAGFEKDSDSLTARANFATMLYYSGTSYTEALAIMQKLNAQSGSTNSREQMEVSMPKETDMRLISYNYAQMLLGLGETVKAEKIREEMKAMLYPKTQGQPFVLRNIKLKDNTDKLLEHWGKPSSIIYNFAVERWVYANLNVQVYLSTYDSVEQIFGIAVERESPVSLPGDVRTGDTRASFEAFYGKPVYHCADKDVYFFNGNTLAVLYCENIIQTVTLE